MRDVVASGEIQAGPVVNWERLQAGLAAAGVDAVVATTAQNVTYVSDYWSLSHWSRRSAQVFAIALRSPTRRVVLVVPLGNADLISTDPQLAPSRVEPFGYFPVAADGIPAEELSAEERQLSALARQGRRPGALAVLVPALRAELGERAAVAVESGGLLEGDLELLRAELAGWRIVPAEALLRDARTIKTAAEVDRLRRAAQLTEAAFADAVAGLGAGSTEQDVDRAIHGAFLRGGGAPFLASTQGGRRTALPNGQPGDRRLRQGDLIRFDGGCRYRLYGADIARIAVLGEPDPKQRRYYGAVVAGLEAAVAAARPGARCRDVFTAAVGAVRDSGIPHYERAHCGHGIGIENYDAPRITPESTDVLEPGMVICLETPYYELGWGGVQAEDTFVVTADGLERFTRMPADIIQVPAGAEERRG